MGTLALEPWRRPELLVPDLLCVLVCVVAVVTDLRARRIPNWLTFPAILVGLVINTTLPPIFLEGVGWTVGLFSSLAGCLLLLLTFGFLGFINFVGMGDVKLMAAVGALLRWPVALWALAYVALAGGGVAVLYSVLGGKAGAVARNLLRLGGRVVRRRSRPKKGREGEPEAEVQLHRIPYAVAVLIGAAWAAAVKYFPVLGVP